MMLIPIVITVILLALVFFYITRPLFTHQPIAGSTYAPDVKALKQAAYQAILERIRELDFDFGLGKMSQQEHEEQRTLLLQEAAVALRELKMVDSPPGSA